MDPVRLAKLVDQQAAALVLYAQQWCAAPEDVVQEAFVKLAAQRRPPDRVLAWLYLVVRNAARSAARSERRRRQHEAAAAREVNWFVPSEGLGLDGKAATEALAALPGDLREPVVAHLWGGLTFAEIGELMRLSSSTAHRRYLEGLVALRERLRVPCPNETPRRS